MNAPNIRRPRPSARYQRQPSIMRVLPIRPQFGGLFIVSRQLELRSTMLFDDLADDSGCFLQGSRRRTLKLEKETILLWPFTLGHSIFVSGSHEAVVH